MNMYNCNRFYLILSVAVVATIIPNNAHAYLDAGTGSYLIQLAVAFVAGGLFMVKIFWHRFLSFFGGRKIKSTDQTKDRASEKSETDHPDTIRHTDGD